MKTGFICGVFDLYHAGHAMALKECKSNCDYLILALNRAENLSKDKNQPVFSFDERKAIVQSIKHIDEIIEYNSEEELLLILKSKKIDIRFLGEDYRNKPITGVELKIPIHYINRSHGFSTSSVIERIKKKYS